MYPDTPKTISNIDLEVDISGTSAEENDLSIISQDVDKVKVQVTGDRTQYSNLKSENLIAHAVVENVTQAGRYQLSIEVTSLDGTDFDVESIEPAYVTVDFDKYVTKEVPIVVDAPNIKVKDGYIMDEGSPQISPSTISITGPQSKVDTISKLSVKIPDSQELDNYYTCHSSDEKYWTLYNENGGTLDFENLTYDVADIQVDYQAYLTKTLPLTYTIVNATSDLMPEFTLSTDEIVVASSDASLETLESISIGEIDMREVDLNYSKEFTIDLPSTYRNISGIDTVTVTWNSNSYSKKEFSNLTNFVVANAPSNYEVEVIPESLNVELVAPTSVIDQITQDDFVIKIDLSNVTINGSLFNAPVTIQLPNVPNAWCVGKYIVALRATELTTQSESETDTTTVTTS
jgi:YbbR domain-containing protein